MDDAQQPGPPPRVDVDHDDPEGFTVVVGGVPSSYVHLGDPTRLEFEYVRWTGRVLDLLAEPGEPLHTLHVGGAGCTLPRYVAATRPRSRQVVLEPDAAVIDLVRERFGYSRRSGFRLRQADGLEGLAAFEAGAFDVVVRDAFAGDTTPAHLTTSGFVQAVARVLTPHGTYVANVADRAGMELVRREVATVQPLLRHVLLIGETQHLRGRRYGNVLLVASRHRLPVAGLERVLASDPVATRVVDPARTRALAAGASAIT
ncbi:spermidine synthase [Angustibacter aerolatus]